jgi:hypothetical protein
MTTPSVGSTGSTTPTQGPTPLDASLINALSSTTTINNAQALGGTAGGVGDTSQTGGVSQATAARQITNLAGGGKI